MGLGFGAGRAYEEADGNGTHFMDVAAYPTLIAPTAMFRRGDVPTGREGLRLMRPYDR